MAFAFEGPELSAMLARIQETHPRKIDLSLDRIRRLLERLGNPERRLPPIIHVAGTNGKGSTIAFLRAIAEAAGLKVHVYTSPHLVRFNERIRLGGRLVSDDELVDALEACERAAIGITPTFFEITTAAAFYLFARAPADLVILEVGLGGRFDATNVIPHAAASIINVVDLDHMEFLGNELEDIAREKAGIIRANCPVFIGRQRPEAELSILHEASTRAAPFFGLGRDWIATSCGNSMLFTDSAHSALLPRPALLGRHQIDNAGLAIAAILSLKLPQITAPIIAKGLQTAQWPARLHRLTSGPLGRKVEAAGGELWLDGAHNPNAASALTLALFDLNVQNPRPLFLVSAMLKTKNMGGFFQTLGFLEPNVLTVPISGNVNGTDENELAKVARAHDLPAESVRQIDHAVDLALARATAPPRIVICGSLYLAGTVLAHEETVQ